jgi:hypothetical protein
MTTGGLDTRVHRRKLGLSPDEAARSTLVVGAARREMSAEGSPPLFLKITAWRGLKCFENCLIGVDRRSSAGNFLSYFNFGFFTVATLPFSHSTCTEPAFVM